MRSIVAAATILLGAALVWLVAALAGLTGFVYIVLFLLAATPGLPVGFALFGRRHAAGWIAGIPIGYAMTALACWVVVFARMPSTPAFLLAWGGVSALSWFVWRARRGTAPLVSLPVWGATDSAALLLTLLLVPALVGPPLANVGATDSEGNRLYRAYFTADFVWHTALVAELAKQSEPPRNPYLAAEPIHYYWTYFLVPATIAAQTHADIEAALKLNALGTALLFVAAIYLAGWVTLPRHPFAVAAGVALTVVASSAEGLAASVDLLRRGRSLAELKEINIDAAAAWAFKGLRIDDLPRSMWYNPQHSFACALGLVALPVAIASGVQARTSAIVLAGLALGLAFTFNPFVGAVLSAVYGIAIVFDAVRLGAPVSRVFRHALAAAPVAAAFGWCALNQVTEGAGGALHIGLFGPARNAPLITFLLSFGPILLPMIAGLWPSRSTPLISAWPALAGIVVSVVLMFFVTLTVDLFWVGFRTGQIFFILAPAIVARGFVLLWSPRLRRFGVALAVIVVITGLPTTIIDAYNAQDVTNRLMGPGFHWTVVVTPAEREAFKWIKANTPVGAVVQAEPTIRGRETWSLIPSFAERRMAAGLPISLLNVPAYAVSSNQVRDVYAGTDATAARNLAKTLGIDYVYVDRTERAAYPAVSKFDEHPEYFSVVFKNTEVSLYRLQ
jgi:hypothetical protein